jgi:site-specific recombinase XerD
MAAKKNVTHQYRDHLTKVGKSPHTVRAYAHDLAAFARWFEQTAGEDFDPQAVDPRDIQEYKGYLIQKGWKPATINRRLIALSRFFRWAKQEGLIGDNPFEVLEQVLFKEQKDTAPRWLDRKEQLALLRAVRRAAGEL